jgi:hypothetical protein
MTIVILHFGLDIEYIIARKILIIYIYIYLIIMLGKNPTIYTINN